MEDVNLVIPAEELGNLLLRAETHARRAVAIRVDPNLLIKLIQNYQPPR